MDDCSPEALAIEIYASLSFKRIIRTLEIVNAWRGKPQVIRADTGPEFTFKNLRGCVKRTENEDLVYSTRQTNAERLPRRIQSCLPRGHSGRPPVHRYVGFITLTEEWIEEYNERRPHKALQNRTPTKKNQQVQPNVTP